jgi:hypothetical protein
MAVTSLALGATCRSDGLVGDNPKKISTRSSQDLDVELETQGDPRGVLQGAEARGSPRLV